MKRLIAILSFVFAGCSPVLTCDRATLALWQDKNAESNPYTATIRCYTSGAHVDRHVLRSKTKITSTFALSKPATATGDAP